MIKTFLVDGDKGGVGKTTVARAITHAYVEHEANGLPESMIYCFDADHTNPDFCGPGGYEQDDKISASALVNLDHPKDWLELLNDLGSVLESSAEREVRIIISLPATAKRAFDNGSGEVDLVLQTLNVVPIWVMGRTPDSVIQLQSRLDSMPSFEHGVAVQNLFFGDRDKFRLWDTSKTKEESVGTGRWLESSIPELSDLIVTKIGRTPWHAALANSTGERGQKLGMGDLIGLRAFAGRAAAALSVAEMVGK